MNYRSYYLEIPNESSREVYIAKEVKDFDELLDNSYVEVLSDDGDVLFTRNIESGDELKLAQKYYDHLVELNLLKQWLPL